jgi:hypothetical protein
VSAIEAEGDEERFWVRWGNVGYGAAIVVAKSVVVGCGSRCDLNYRGGGLLVCLGWRRSLVQVLCDAVVVGAFVLESTVVRIGE